MMSQRSILGLSLISLFAICVYPFLVLFYKVRFPDGGAFTFQYVQSVMGHGGTLKAFKNTVLVSFAVSSLSLLIAVPLGWLMARTDLPLARSFRSWFCLPYAIPPYIGAIAWIWYFTPECLLLLGTHLG